MFRFFRTPMDRQFIDGGRVPCPKRSCDVELDICAACRWMRQIDNDAKLPFVRCEPPPTLFIPGM